LFFVPDPSTYTGSPVITTQLFNGTNLLGTVVSAPSLFGGSYYYEALFESASGFPEGAPTAIVDLTSMQNATMQGILKVTISGGSISGINFSAANNSNLNSLELEDATSDSAGYAPENDLPKQTQTFEVTTTPEPTTALALSGLCLWGFCRSPKRKALNT
jgi:hypothetical protein